jgi:hypothetical protein
MNDHGILKQHDQTYNRAILNSNILCVGPFPRSKFPLLKLERKHKEYFLRTDKFCINRYYLDNNKNQTTDLLFYPSDKGMEEIKRIKELEENSNLYVRLYDKLVSDGLGSIQTHIRKPLQKINLKKKGIPPPSKKLVLKKKTKKLELKAKPKKNKLVLKSKSKKLKLKRKG